MNDKYIKIALNEALKAYKSNEVPVGAVIVKEGKIISKAHNMVEKHNNSLFHAEILAITKASKKIHNWRLNNCEIYVTLEPCNLCKQAIEASRISKVYYLVSKTNEFQTNKVKYQKINNYSEDALKLLQVFFKAKRN